MTPVRSHPQQTQGRHRAGLHPRRRPISLVLTLVAAVLVPVGSATATSGPVTRPVVAGISPSSVTAGGGSSVTITGTGFTSATEVSFGPNASSNVVVMSDSTIVATAPVGAGTVAVTVRNPRGASITTPLSALTYQPTGQVPITAAGTALELGGTPTRFTGANAYQLATSWGTNAGCGGMATTSQINSFFSQLAPNSLVRFWVFQGTLGTNASTHALDWAPIDQIFYLAAQNHIYLIPTITDQGGVCDGGHWQDPAWFAGGYRNVFNTAANSDGTGADPLSYWTYMQDIVNRYKSSPALGMWEPISEPDPATCDASLQPNLCAGNVTCPDEAAAAAALSSFFQAVGGKIHSLDPNHLVEAGFLGSGQCGTANGDYATVGAGAGIDVLSVHDYYGSTPMGGDQWNGLAVRFNQAAAINKPIITGETGVTAGIGQSDCESLDQRAVDFQNKENAQFAAGSSALLVWNWDTDTLGPCRSDTGPGDPLMTLLNR